MRLPNLAIVLYKNKGNELADGKYPIKLRITINRKPQYIGLGLSAHPHRWDKKKERLNSKAPEHQMLNYDLDDHMFVARGILREFREKKKPFSFDTFKNKFLRKNIQVTVCEFFDILISEFQKAKTAQFYCDSKNAIHAFCNNPNLLFTDIDYNWLKQFELHFTRRGKKGVAYMRALKAAYGEAIARGIVEQSYYPFKSKFNFSGYSFSHLNAKKKRRKTHFRTLTAHEIELMKNFPIEKYPGLIEGYDYFMCSYYCFGINLKDIIQMTEDDIEGDVVYWDRSKTGIEGCGILTPALLRILERHKNKSKYLFPVLSQIPDGLPFKQRDELEEAERCNLNRRINKQLLKITKILGVEKFTFYSARETVGTVLIRKDFTAVAVSQVLTHANVTTTDAHYNDGIEIEKIRELAGAL